MRNASSPRMTLWLIIFLIAIMLFLRAKIDSDFLNAILTVDFQWQPSDPRSLTGSAQKQSLKIQPSSKYPPFIPYYHLSIENAPLPFQLVSCNGIKYVIHASRSALQATATEVPESITIAMKLRNKWLQKIQSGRRSDIIKIRAHAQSSSGEKHSSSKMPIKTSVAASKSWDLGLYLNQISTDKSISPSFPTYPALLIGIFFRKNQNLRHW